MSDADVLRPTRKVRAVPLRLRSDDRLARQAARGDTDAFAALYERHHRALYRYCRSIVGDPDDAADALQSAMTRALAAIDRRDERAPVRAWLFRIGHNESISLIRARHGAEPLDPESLVGTDVEVDAERRRRLAQLVADLQALPERQRGALLMRELSGLRHAEIAAAFETSEGAVKQAIYEARTALHDFARGREMDCAAVQRQLSDGDGRTARSRRLRGHLRSCEACSAFRVELLSRRTELAAIAPLLPAATAAAVLESVIGGGGAGGGGLLAGLLGAVGVSKSVAVGAATVTAGAGAVTYTAVAPEEVPPPPVAPAVAQAEPPRAADAATAPDEAREPPVERPESDPPAAKRHVVADRPDARVERRVRTEPEPDETAVAVERAEEAPVEPAAGQEGDEETATPVPPPIPVVEEPAGEEEEDDDEDDQAEAEEPTVVTVSEPEPDDEVGEESDD